MRGGGRKLVASKFASREMQCYKLPNDIFVYFTIKCAIAIGVCIICTNVAKQSALSTHNNKHKNFASKV